MDRPITRTFLQAGERERVLEITWHGGDVEVSIGPRGKPGRVTERMFATPRERDAFIAQRIQKALKEGFVERAVDAPAEPEPVDPETERLARLRAQHLTTSHVPVLAAGDPITGSKYGGTPWLGSNDTWPLCRSCGLPMAFVVQLARDEVPEPLRAHFAAELLQIFACALVGKPDDPSWICRADGSVKGTAPSVFLRFVSIAGPPRAVVDALAPRHLEAWRRTDHERLIAHWRTIDDLETAAIFSAKLAALPPIGPSDYRVPTSPMEARVHRLLLAPAVQITSWILCEEVPSYQDPLSLDDVDDLKEHFDLSCRNGHKLGGHPGWHQDPARPTCCGAPMHFLLQLASSTPVEVGFGGDGTAYVFDCARCHALSMTWQR